MSPRQIAALELIVTSRQGHVKAGLLQPVLEASKMRLIVATLAEGCPADSRRKRHHNRVRRMHFSLRQLVLGKITSFISH